MKSFFKLREHLDQLDEISRETLRSYIGKAGDEIHKNKVEAGRNMGTPAADAPRAKYKKRQKGYDKAVARYIDTSPAKLREDSELAEAKIGDKVEITHGSQKGLVGHVGEIRKGLGGTNHTYTVDYDDNGKRASVQVKKAHTKLIKEVRSEYSKAAHDEDGQALGIRPGSKEEPNPIVKHEVTQSGGKHYISVVHKSGMSYSHKGADGNTQNFDSKEAAEKKAAELNKKHNV